MRRRRRITAPHRWPRSPRVSASARRYASSGKAACTSTSRVVRASTDAASAWPMSWATTRRRPRPAARTDVGAGPTRGARWRSTSAPAGWGLPDARAWMRPTTTARWSTAAARRCHPRARRSPRTLTPSCRTTTRKRRLPAEPRGIPLIGRKTRAAFVHLSRKALAGSGDNSTYPRRVLKSVRDRSD